MRLHLIHLMTAIALEARFNQSPHKWDRCSFMLGMTDMINIAAKDYCGVKHG